MLFCNALEAPKAVVTLECDAENKGNEETMKRCANMLELSGTDPPTELTDRAVSSPHLQLAHHELPLRGKAEPLTVMEKEEFTPFPPQSLHSHRYLCNVGVIFVQNPCQ